MRVLVACEFSGIVRQAFTEVGHYAVSADLLPTEIPGRHYHGNVLKILDSNWDLIIAHPPCTYLALSGVQWIHKRPERWQLMLEAVDFFNKFLACQCQRVCVENPIMHSYATQRIHRPHTQIIKPHAFGHPVKKATCLWLKNLPQLKATNNVHLEMFMSESSAAKIHMAPDSKNRAKERSRTFTGIAQAMASQWGNQ
jgi:hypothetical protein